MKLLNAQEVKMLLEESFVRRIYDIGMIGEGEDIENSNHKALYIYLLEERDLAKANEVLRDVLNVIQVSVSGHPQAASTDVPTPWNIVLGG